MKNGLLITRPLATTFLYFEIVGGVPNLPTIFETQENVTSAALRVNCSSFVPLRTNYTIPSILITSQILWDVANIPPQPRDFRHALTTHWYNARNTLHH